MEDDMSEVLLTEDEVIERVLEKRYYAPGETSQRQMYARVINAIIGSAVPERSRYNLLMEQGVFLPNSPTLVNAGRPDSHGTLSACFVLPINDSLDGIDKACNDMGHVHKAFGGTGFSFGRLRAKGSLIHSTGGGACGPVKVLQLLDAKANMVGQGGKREGGNMGVLPVDHPDIMEWISCKKNQGIKHFNISVAVSEAFMNDLLDPIEDSIYKIWPCRKNSKEIFDAICEAAHAEGNPGLIFIDRINANRPEGWPLIESTNPCGEQPLADYESCNLGSINLGAFVYSDGRFDYEGFKEAIHDAVRFLDAVIDKNNYPIPEIKEATLRTRNIGLGIMGWADCLIKMGIPYASEEALDLISKIGHVLSNTAAETSIQLAKELGPYPAWDESITKQPRRNYTCTTIAPTGTLSKLARCSPGIEPIYDWHMEIFTEQGTYIYDYPFMEEVIRHGRQGDTALRIPIKWHIAHQAAWQRWIDNAVSKTINLPTEATVAEVRSAFGEAYRAGCKGITIYRDRSRDEQVLRSESEKSTGEVQKTRNHKFTCRPGRLYEVNSGCGKMFIWIDQDGGKQHEVFVVSSGGCTANNESTGRILSDEMQRGVSVADITRPLKKVKCINAMKNPNAQGNSCSDIIGKVIDEDWELYYAEPVVLRKPSEGGNESDRCPSCGAAIVLTGGCSTGMCMACGWSGCS